MLSRVVSLLCALAVLTPTAAFAGERYDRRDFNYGRSIRPIERVQIINFGNRNRAFDRRDDRRWERRDARRDWERQRDWRDRRDDRRDYRRDPYRSRIIIIPRISF